MLKTTLRPATSADTEALLAIAIGTGLFSPPEAQALLGSTLDELHAGKLADGHAAAVIAEGDRPVGWTYFAPDPHADGVWNLWWIGVHPTRHGTHDGTRLLEHVEAVAVDAGARLLVVETSALAPTSRARRFYARQGYAVAGRIPDFYAAGDDKMIFVKRLSAGRDDRANDVRLAVDDPSTLDE